MTTTKKCTKCGEVKGLDEFVTNRKAKDGKRPECKACAKEYLRTYYKQNHEKFSQYREQKREKRNEYNRQYREQNREKHAEQCRQWREQNRQKCIEYLRQYREQNREKRNEYNRQYKARQKAMREFFKMHKAMAEITEALQQYIKP